MLYHVRDCSNQKNNKHHVSFNLRMVTCFSILDLEIWYSCYSTQLANLLLYSSSGGFKTLQFSVTITPTMRQRMKGRDDHGTKSEDSKMGGHIAGAKKQGLLRGGGMMVVHWTKSAGTALCRLVVRGNRQ